MSNQIELRHLHYFRIVAEELHFRKAAERLFISQPGLSRQIKQLEELLEVTLFERDKRNVKLTAAGNYLKDEVTFIENHMTAIQKQIKLIDSGEEGEIRIGFVGSAMQNVLSDLLMDLNTSFPKIHAQLEELSVTKQIHAVQHDELDLGFVRINNTPLDLISLPVYEDTFSIVIPEDHKLTTANFKHVGQLQEESFILFSNDYSPLYYNKIMSICSDRGFNPKISHKSVHANTIFKLVESGLGVAIIPTALQHGFDFKVRFIELNRIKQRTQLSVIWKASNRNPILHNVLSLLNKS